MATSLLRRLSVASCLFVAAAVVSVGASPPASACALNPDSAHCYGQVISNPAAIHGVHGDIDPVCLNTGGVNPAFITDEMWLVSTASAPTLYWVEAGYLQNNGVDLNGVGNGQWIFWADQRPGGGFNSHGHLSSGLPKAHFSIGRDSSSQVGVLYGSYSGTSTSNGMTENQGQYGSEMTTSAAGGQGQWSSIGYRNGSGTWNSGVVNESTRVDSYQYFSWDSYDTSFTGGPFC